MDQEEKDMQNKIANLDLEIRQFNSKLLDNQVQLILLDLQKNMVAAYPEIIDVDSYARKIVAHCREHIQ